ncbi:DUF4185 domain-containing protein [Jiangella asiatica]|uniref:DUF4185 domain-containing protein n=1 Tax=Jiangella asiatica TaxID=2530372 RepID=A0A4R5CQN3_9ACTN|nr:DUF4185 domain-containing protein [Jiangella asiatica]TDD99922.1 DUF4185 domain-containing protein [Jiangella asiatica]
MPPPARLPIHRARAVLASAALLLTVGAVSVPANAQDADRSRSAEAPELPEVELSEVFNAGPRHLTALDGTVYSPLEEPPIIMGHDNGQSTLYDNGEGLRFSYWSNGDTGLTEPNSDGKRFLGNTAARTTDLDMSDNVTEWVFDGDGNGPQEAWKLNADEEAWNELHLDTDAATAGCQPAAGVEWMQCGDEYAIWGAGIIADPDNERILSFYNLIKRYHALAEDRPDPDNPGQTIPCTEQDVIDRNEACRAFLFDGVGLGIAEWTETTADGDGWERINITNATDPAIPTALWPYDDDPATQDTKFDNAFFLYDGYIYAYGCFEERASGCALSRVPTNDPAYVFDRQAWQFYAGTERDKKACPEKWAADAECRVALPVDTNGGPAQTLSGGAAGSSVFWNPELELFMWIHSGFWSNDLLYRVADRPEGPWSQAGVLGTAVPSAGEGFGSVSYAGFAHPEYAEDNGLVQYITYAHTTGFFRSDLGIHKVRFADPDS